MEISVVDQSPIFTNTNADQAIRDSVKKAGIKLEDLERIIFVGGPTNYKPLRDKISFEIGVQGGIDVNPMTAVAEGASIFAESIDWASKNRERKQTTEKITAKGEFDIDFQYKARTVSSKARIRFVFGEKILNNGEYQIDSLDTGWSSGRIKLENASSLELDLSKEGENKFNSYTFLTLFQRFKIKRIEVNKMNDTTKSY